MVIPIANILELPVTRPSVLESSTANDESQLLLDFFFGGGLRMEIIVISKQAPRIKSMKTDNIHDLN